MKNKKRKQQKKKGKKVKAKKQRAVRQGHQVVEVRIKTEAQPQSHAIIPTGEPILPKDLEPVKAGKSLMIPKSWVSQRQASFIIQKTPAKYVKRRKGRGGMMFDYVPGHYIKRALNFGFGWNWDFFIDHQEVLGMGTDWAQVITRGHLVVKDDAGHTITKTDNGKADVKYLKGTKQPMDIGNDFKASATDCLKRCAVQLGIASDVYGAEEMKGEGYVVTETNKPTPPAPAAGSGLTGFECHEGAEPITKAVYDYSKQVYGKPLCQEHQKTAKKKI